MRPKPKMLPTQALRTKRDHHPLNVTLRVLHANSSSSLYIKNLNEKINKNELKRALYMLFSTYGPVLDIVTTRVGAKGQNMRGQAHIVYRDIQTSTQAMRALQGFDLFGKEIVRVPNGVSCWILC